jgi:hypothetical protein
LAGPHQHCDGSVAERLVAIDQQTQRLLHGGLALLRRQMQDLQVFPVGTRRQRLVKQVISHAEAAAREQRLPVTVVGQGPRLPHQSVDHVPIVDVLLAPPPQAWQRLNQLLAVPHFQVVQVHAHLDPFADQPAVHRIDVVLHVNQAAARHGHIQPLAHLQPPRRQRPQPRLLLGQPRRPARIPLPPHVFEKRRIRFPIGKVPAAAQQQRLVHRLLEMPMRRLDIAVLVRLPRLNPLAHQSVMRQQRLIALAELPPLRQVVDRRTHPVAAVPLRHAAQLRQRILQTDAQTLETLAVANRHRLPVRVRQHKVVHQVGESLPADGHVQAVHVREIRGAQPTRMMHLAEIHFLAWPLRRPPVFDPPLEGPHLPVGEASRILLPQPLPQRLGLQLRLSCQLLGHRRPHLGKGIGPRPPIARRSRLFTGKPFHVPIPPCRLPIDPRPAGRRAKRPTLPQKPKQPPYMDIRDHCHRKLLPCWNLR